MRRWRVAVAVAISPFIMSFLHIINLGSITTQCNPTIENKPTEVLQSDSTMEMMFLKELNAPWDQKNTRREISKINIHFWFVIECNIYSPEYSLWQALTLEHSWFINSGVGAITRLVPGCSPHPDFSNLVARYGQQDISKETVFSSVYFTPKSEITSGMSDVKYGPGNRPPAALYWIQKAVIPEDFLIAIDPDFIFRNPLLPPVGYHNHLIGQPYTYLSQPGTRHWPTTVSELCGNHSRYGLQYVPSQSRVLLDSCNMNYKDSEVYNYGIFVPLGMSKKHWEIAIPLWETAIRMVRKIHPIQESDMMAFSWTVASLRIDTMVWEPCMSWAVEDRWLNTAVTDIDADCIHYYAPTEVDESNTYGMVSGNQIIFDFKTPQQLLKFEIENNRPLVESVFFSKTKFNPTEIMNCKGTLLFEYPPLPYLIKSNWFTETQLRWLWQHLELIKAVNKAIIYHREMTCSVRGSDEKILRPWITPGFIPYMINSKSFLSAYEVVYDDSNDGFHFKAAKWAHWKSHNRKSSKALDSNKRFLWEVISPASVTSFDESGLRSAPHAFLSPGSVVDVVRISHGMVKLIMPVIGWVDLSSLKSNISTTLFAELTGGI